MTETFAILERVNALYSNAFTQLITYTVGIVAFVGVLVPLTVALLQLWKSQGDRKLLEETIKTEVEKAKAAMQQELLALFNSSADAQKAATEKLVQNQEHLTRGGLSYINGRQLMNSDELTFATTNFANAIHHISLSSDGRNLTPSYECLVSCANKLKALNPSKIDRIDAADALKLAYTAYQRVSNVGQYAREIRTLMILEAELRNP